MKRLTYTLLLLAFLPACRQAPDELPVTPADPKTPLEITVSGISMQQPRSVISSESDLDGKKIGIYAINAQSGESSYGTAPAGTAATYAVATDGNGGYKATAVTGKELWLNNQSATIYATYPIADPNDITPGSNSGDAPALPVKRATFAEEQTLTTTPVAGTPDYYDLTDPQYDYMYGVAYITDSYLTTQPEADNGSPAVSIGFRHALAQVRFKLKKGTDYPGPARLTYVKFTFSNLPALKNNNTSLMSLKDGSMQNLEAAQSRHYAYTLSAVVTLDADGLEFRTYALPVSTTGLTEVQMTLDGKTMTLSPSSPSDKEWAAGNIYRYSFTARGTGLTLSSFQVVDWTTGETTDDVPIN